jgi:hypothetical protein
MLQFPRGVLAPLIGVAVRWFTFVNHGKLIDLISENLDKELWKVRTTLLFDGNIVFYCYMSLLRRFAIGKLHAPECHVFCPTQIVSLVHFFQPEWVGQCRADNCVEIQNLTSIIITWCWSQVVLYNHVFSWL